MEKLLELLEKEISENIFREIIESVNVKIKNANMNYLLEPSVKEQKLKEYETMREIVELCRLSQKELETASLDVLIYDTDTLASAISSSSFLFADFDDSMSELLLRKMGEKNKINFMKKIKKKFRSDVDFQDMIYDKKVTAIQETIAMNPELFELISSIVKQEKFLNTEKTKKTSGFV